MDQNFEKQLFLLAILLNILSNKNLVSIYVSNKNTLSIANIYSFVSLQDYFLY